MAKFQSTRPARGATGCWSQSCLVRYISIHAPREGRDAGSAYAQLWKYISIHAPREGRDGTDGQLLL